MNQLFQIIRIHNVQEELLVLPHQKISKSHMACKLAPPRREGPKNWMYLKSQAGREPTERRQQNSKSLPRTSSLPHPKQNRSDFPPPPAEQAAAHGCFLKQTTRCGKKKDGCENLYEPAAVQVDQKSLVKRAKDNF